MLSDVPEICKACATGLNKYRHNMDLNTCRYGRLAAIELLETDEEKIESLRVEERLNPYLAKMVVSLAKERGKTILEVLREENLLSD